MRRSIAAALAVPYLLVLLNLTLVLDPSHGHQHVPLTNLMPLRSIVLFLHKGGREMMINIVGNLVAFMPVGFLLPLWRDEPTSARQVALAGAALSAFIEVAQYFTCRRVADVDDILLNALGAILGFGVYLGLKRWLARRPSVLPGR